MIESSCTRGAVSGALFICLSGWEVVGKVPLTGHLLCFLSPNLLRGFRDEENLETVVSGNSSGSSTAVGNSLHLWSILCVRSYVLGWCFVCI